MLRDRRVAVCVSGSIACYKAASLVRLLVADSAQVRVAMTESAAKFVGPATFAALSGNPVLVDVFNQPERVPHVELGRWAEVCVLAATSATTLHRLASGDASDAVSATYLMFRGSVVCAPAMHTEMWEHPATQKNVEALRSFGVVFVGPEVGALASGDWGVGRMVSPESIVEQVCSAFCPKDLEGRRVVVTAGPTREPIDAVRFISNRSAGLMGMEISRELIRRGASVTLVCGPTYEAAPPEVELVCVQTANEMREAVITNFAEADALVMAAAVADFAPVSPGMAKAAKSDKPFEMTLVPTPDIATECAQMKRDGQLIVLFAAETSDEVQKAKRKLLSKGGDLIVANTVGVAGSGFDSATNRAWLIDADNSEDLGTLTKKDLSHLLCDRIVKLFGAGR